MAYEDSAKRVRVCAQCERPMSPDENGEEVEIFRYSRHNVGVAHVGRQCTLCQQAAQRSVVGD